MIAATLVLEEKGKIGLITGYANVQEAGAGYIDCKTTFTYETCLLEAGIGEYDVLIQDNAIIITSLTVPKLVAISNNTRVDYTIGKVTGHHPSTLGGILANFTYRWAAWVSSWKPRKGPPTVETLSEMSVEIYEREHSPCNAFRSPREDMMASLNKLMVYMGALASSDNVDNVNSGHMDPGYSFQSTTLASPIGKRYIRRAHGARAYETHADWLITRVPTGKQDVYRTHYAFFVAAAAVEIICILLVAPT